MQIHELTALARQMKASDIHISEGLPLMFRIDGRQCGTSGAVPRKYECRWPSSGAPAR